MKASDNITDMNRIFRKQFYKDNHLSCGILVAVMILSSGINLWISYLLQQITDAAISGRLEVLGKICVVTLVSFFATIAVLLAERYVKAVFIKKAMLQYKNRVFAEITKKSIHSFSGENTARYISALTNDAASVETNYVEGIFKLIVEAVGFAGAFSLMLYYSPILTAAAVLLSLVPVLASLFCGSRMAAAEKAVSDENEGFVAMVKDMLSGFAVIKSFKAEREIQRLYETDNERLEKVKYDRRMTADMIRLISSAAALTAQFGVFLTGAYVSITRGTVTPGILIAFVNLMNFVVSPIGTVPQLLGNRKAAKALIDKLSKTVTENVRAEGKTVDNVLDEGIVLDNVSFGYTEASKALKNVSHTFSAGKSYAIVGASGSGKSTLLNLLMGSCGNYEGSIDYDKDELKTICTDSLYDLISIVQQNVFVFNSSIRDNITMFREFDDAKVERAIRMSGLEALIREKGEDYLCGENGCNLSGGERQRISIARCLLRETPVLLVDEATAALDAETAFSVTNAILQMEGLTRIVVTHRLEDRLLEQYDEIIVMKNGEIIENGGFMELLERKEYFYSLYNVSR